MFRDVLIDSCVLMDALFVFRANHKIASELLHQLAANGIVCYVPSHAYFEYAVTCITHFKREPEKLGEIDRKLLPQGLKLQVVTLSGEYADHLIQRLSERALPDLKSQDLIYFCIARDRGMTLITEDKKLRNTARKGGIESLLAREALEVMNGRNTESSAL